MLLGPDDEACGLNGNAYGGATDFALACDFRIGVEGSRLQMPPARLGIQYYHSDLRRYVERLGLPEAKRLFLTGEEINTATLADRLSHRNLCAREVRSATGGRCRNARSAFSGLAPRSQGVAQFSFPRHRRSGRDQREVL
ncbi:enoyl-CoA hydratase-related protein [Bradyrhizobium sp. GCM10028915]|uniref:enoyl-CoA hydratase-related protein n=1 Tax=Bradyrhizobium sp. GCM10028915 TaxID=3273385 RepID=UPI003605B77A